MDELVGCQRVIARDPLERFEPARILFEIGIGQGRSVRDGPDRVVLQIPPAVGADDLIEIEQVCVFVLLQLAAERLVQLLDEIDEVAEIVARQQPPHRVLLRYEKIADKCQDAMRLVPAHQIVQHVREPAAHRIEQPFECGGIGIRQAEISVLVEQLTKRDLDQLKIVRRRGARRVGGQLGGVVDQEVLGHATGEAVLDNRRPGRTET